MAARLAACVCLFCPRPVVAGLCAGASQPISPPPLQTSTSNDSLEQLSGATGALHLNVPSATPSASSRSLPSQLHSPAFTAMMASPLASSHHKFPLPGDPGYIKRQTTDDDRGETNQKDCDSTRQFRGESSPHGRFPG